MHYAITLPWLALLGQVFSPLVGMVCYLSGRPLDNLFQLRFQPLHYGFNGLWKLLQLGQSLKKMNNMPIFLLQPKDRTKQNIKFTINSMRHVCAHECTLIRMPMNSALFSSGSPSVRSDWFKSRISCCSSCTKRGIRIQTHLLPYSVHYYICTSTQIQLFQW